MSQKKVIVIHPDRQHSLQTALALQKSGCLYKYITTVYLKKNSISFLLSSIAPARIKRKFLKHKLDGLDDSKVLLICQVKMLILSLASLFMTEDSVNKYRLRIINEFNKKCLNYCLRQDFDVLISYDTLSGNAFKELKNKGVKLVLDMSAPCFLEMYDNFRKDVDRNPDDSGILNQYLKSPKVLGNIKRCKEELSVYDFFLAASAYTRDTLVRHGIDSSYIQIVPYGLPKGTIINREVNSSFTCSYVGSVTQQKGCHYIFRLAKLYPDVTFNLVGAYDNSYMKIPSNCVMHGYLAFDQIKRVLESTDLFLFLSLSDGFGFAAAEAMAYGVPVICSKNAGVCDYIDGNGWIVSPENIEDVSSIIDQCIKNPEMVKDMGIKSQNKVKGVGWDDYCRTLTDVITIL
jgi:glycosyltransferase involved in cell wall biosynthesis